MKNSKSSEEYNSEIHSADELFDEEAFDEELECVAGGNLPIDLADPKCIYCQGSLKMRAVAGIMRVFSCRNCKRFFALQNDGVWIEMKKPRS